MIKYIFNSINCTKEVADILLLAYLLAYKSNSIFLQLNHIKEAIKLKSNEQSDIVKSINKRQPILNHIIFGIPKNSNIKPVFSVEVLKLFNSILNLKKRCTTVDILEQLHFLKIYYSESYYNPNFKVNNDIIIPFFKSNVTGTETSFLTKIADNLLTSNIKTTTILGRSLELNQIFEILIRTEKNNIILIGKEGVGKHYLIQALKHVLLFNSRFISSINKEFWVINFQLIFKLSNNGELEDKLNEFLNKSKTRQIVLILFNIQLFINFKQSSEIKPLTFLLDIINQFKNIQILGTTSLNKTDLTLLKTDLYKNKFECIEIKDLPENTIKIILNKTKENLEKKYDLKLDRGVLKNIITISKMYFKDDSLLYQAKFLLDTIYSKKRISKLCTKKNSLEKLITNDDLTTLVSSVKQIPSYLINKKLSKKESFNFKLVKEILEKRIFGQEKAISQILGAVKRVQVGLKSPTSPLGSWILCGPSGTGKTELAKSLAKVLFGSESELVRFDMSEFMEKHSTSRLIGSPPGYIGYGEGGQLTDWVKKKPYTVLLFDEIEKAHKDITNLMLQLLDEGRLTDSSGITVDFSNTLIIFTSNLGCPKTNKELKSYISGNPRTGKINYDLFYTKIIGSIKNYFKPEFLNRLTNIIVFQPLSLDCLGNIAKKFLDDLILKLYYKQINLQLDLTKEALTILTTISYQPIYGARPLKRLIETLIEKPISEILEKVPFGVNSYILSIRSNEISKNLEYFLSKT